MPTPGSHRYDVRRTRLRGELESEGIPDKHADEAANEAMRRNSSAASPGLHWLVTGIAPGTTSIAEGEVPPGADVWPNDYGDLGYGGPLPPGGDGPHRYIFRLLALGSPLGMSGGADAAEVRAALEDRRLATGTLTGLFAR
jgi:phosphatidylethanolamine-binding protein (PEBP) family uncharacterized protein